VINSQLKDRTGSLLWTLWQWWNGHDKMM